MSGRTRIHIELRARLLVQADSGTEVLRPGHLTSLTPSALQCAASTLKEHPHG